VITQGFVLIEAQGVSETDNQLEGAGTLITCTGQDFTVHLREGDLVIVLGTVGITNDIANGDAQCSILEGTSNFLGSGKLSASAANQETGITVGPIHFTTAGTHRFQLQFRRDTAGDATKLRSFFSVLHYRSVGAP